MTQKHANFRVMRQDRIHAQSIANMILESIRGHGRGWVFTPANFKGVGSRTAVESALRRHKNEGIIRQLARGLYDYPRTDPQLGILAPSIDQITSALEVRDAVRLQPSGAYAANLLGLSDQVPMKVVFLTDGPTRNLQVGNRQILLKHTTPRNMATAGRISGTVIQALRWLGQRHVDERVTSILKRRLDAKGKEQLLKDIQYAPIWITKVFRTIAKDGQS
jgi:hypothetical protein